MVSTKVEVRKEFMMFVEDAMNTMQDIQMLVELLQAGNHDDYVRVIRELPELVDELTHKTQDTYWTLVTEGDECDEHDNCAR